MDQKALAEQAEKNKAEKIRQMKMNMKSILDSAAQDERERKELDRKRIETGQKDDVEKLLDQIDQEEDNDPDKMGFLRKSAFKKE